MKPTRNTIFIYFEVNGSAHSKARSDDRGFGELLADVAALCEFIYSLNFSLVHGLFL